MLISSFINLGPTIYDPIQISNLRNDRNFKEKSLSQARFEPVTPQGLVRRLSPLSHLGIFKDPGSSPASDFVVTASMVGNLNGVINSRTMVYEGTY